MNFDDGPRLRTRAIYIFLHMLPVCATLFYSARVFSACGLFVFSWLLVFRFDLMLLSRYMGIMGYVHKKTECDREIIAEVLSEYAASSV